MNLDSIAEILKTVSIYNTVDITQTFGKDGVDLVIVKCVKNTSTLQVTFVQTEQVNYYKSVNEAARVIESEIHSHTYA